MLAGGLRWGAYEELKSTCRLRTMTLYAKRLTGAHSAINALTKGLWAFCEFAPHGGICARLECRTSFLNGNQQREHSTLCNSSTASQASSTEPPACLPRSAHHRDSSGAEIARCVASLPWRHPHQSNPALGAVRGLLDLAGSRQSYTFASYSSSPGPFTAIRPPFSQPEKTRSLSAGNLQDQIAEANSILQVRLAACIKHIQ